MLSRIAQSSLKRSSDLRTMAASHVCVLQRAIVVKQDFESIRLFHTTPTHLLPVRRRRRGDASHDDNSNTISDSTSNPAKKPLPDQGDAADGEAISIVLDDDNDDDIKSVANLLQHNYVDDDKEFAKASKLLVEKLLNGIKPLKSLNSDLIVTHGVDEGIGDYIIIKIGMSSRSDDVTGAGQQYSIQFDQYDKCMRFITPVSGQFEYVLSTKTGDWVSRVDGHIFIGMLVRDLISQVRGVPNL